NTVTLLALIFAAVQILGFATAISALLSTRTAQGTVAWVVTLIAFPLLGVPAYLIFGRSRFDGYVTERMQGESSFRKKLGFITSDIAPYLSPQPQLHETLNTFEVLAKLPFTEGNQATLLINGDDTFNDILSGIKSAQQYILIQFYIVRDDRLGGQLRQHLTDASKRGVKVFFLYDDIGSYKLTQRYLDDLLSAGVEVHSFHSEQVKHNRFQLNFRNHRKIVVVDGKSTWVGGHNVGDEYLDGGDHFSHWRDTHLRLEGPAV
ncbi:UNVERIFIED_CONTAM: hypothetical protein GTU68_029979, partial [Idotea baltica]|nr:hypothetical protein [Idotea baltica]